MATIFRANVQSAYSAGRYRQLSETAQTRPYWRFSAVLDNRTSSECRSLHGVVLRHDDSFWDRNTPLRHFNCRSGLTSLTRAQAEARGIIRSPPKANAAAGFGMRPGTWEWSPDLAKYPAELQAVYLAKSSGGATGGGGGGRMPNMSDHPVDRLIRQVVARRRTASAAEVAAIVERLATADFNRNLVKVPTAMRGLNYLGKELGERADALIYHLTKRVVEEKQWADGTTIADYLRDLREAVHDSQARLIVYTSRGEVFAAVLAPNRIPPERLGLNPEKFVWVVHSAVRGTLATGYQVGGPETVRLGKDALWLK